MNNYFETVNRSLGWGDLPKEGILFVGLEEACGWKNIPEDKHKIAELQQYLDRGLQGEPVAEGQLKRNRDELKDGQRMSEVPRIMSKIIIESGFDQSTQYKDADDYWFNRLFQEGSKVFQSNLYPLGKPRLKESISPSACELFGVTPDQYSKFVRMKNTSRFMAIKALKENCTPKVTICFGKAGWADFRDLFDLSGKAARMESPFEIYDSERVILTPFFWNKDMHGENIKALGTQISTIFLKQNPA